MRETETCPECIGHPMVANGCRTCFGCGFVYVQEPVAVPVEAVVEDIRPALAAAFEDYARHETEQGNHFLAGVWKQAAEMAIGFVPCANRTKVLSLK